MAEIGLTPRQLQLIDSTWQICKTDLQETGIIMFMKLFEIDPSLLELFPFGDEEISEETEGVKKHSLGVMMTIDAALEMISANEIEKLVTTLVDLGTVHNFHDVKPTHFTAVGQALIHALGVKAGEAFTDEAKMAWISLYSLVQQHMTTGMEEPLL